MGNRAGTMTESMVWAFAGGAALVGVGLGYVPGVISWLLGVALFVAAGWAAGYLTQASTGKGLLAMFALGVVVGMFSFMIARSKVSAAMAGADGNAIHDAVAKAQADGNL